MASGINLSRINITQKYTPIRTISTDKTHEVEVKDTKLTGLVSKKLHSKHKSIKTALSKSYHILTEQKVTDLSTEDKKELKKSLFSNPRSQATYYRV